MMVPRTWKQLAGKKSEDVVQEWLFLKGGASVANWNLLRIPVCPVEVQRALCSGPELGTA